MASLGRLGAGAEGLVYVEPWKKQPALTTGGGMIIAHAPRGPGLECGSFFVPQPPPCVGDEAEETDEDWARRVWPGMRTVMHTVMW